MLVQIIKKKYLNLLEVKAFFLQNKTQMCNGNKQTKIKFSCVEYIKEDLLLDNTDTLLNINVALHLNILTPRLMWI